MAAPEANSICERAIGTTVYVDTLQGRSPDALDQLISLRTCNHSAVCLSELTHLWGRLRPDDPRTKRSLQARKLGWPVVTGNIADFDFLNQLVPDGRILFYRRME